MIISNHKSDIYLSKNFDNTKLIPYLFLHGFTGSHASWEGIYRKIDHPYIVIDIPGHGKSCFNRDYKKYTIANIASDIKNILDQLNINRIKICGYSMGGRLAILFAKKYSNMVDTLFLESSMAGIINRNKRENRLSSDYKLATIINNNFDRFLYYWENLEIFKTQKQSNPKGWETQKFIRKSHSHKQLSKSLKIFSLGNMPPCHDFIKKTSIPIILINGDLDKKFIQYSKELCKLNKTIKHHIITNSSHNVHLESPNNFLSVIKN